MNITKFGDKYLIYDDSVQDVRKMKKEEIEMLWRKSEEFRSYQKAASVTDDVEEMLNLLDCYKSMFMVKIKEQV